ncbi:MAG: hypothetical protein RMJ87_07640 [Cytophagales bacterium]|nr:hypothetical protein [Bernardetiaceae bacterium]MDW8204885.1 hypothetical protein [Cytophagales bacterium]
MASNYEFTPEQEMQMARLARMLRITGIAFISMAIVEESLAFTKAYSVNQLNISIDWMEFGFESISAVLYAFIGITLWRVARSFALLATTEGHDIPHLMDAVKKLIFAKQKQAVLLFLIALHSLAYLYRMINAFL